MALLPGERSKQRFFGVKKGLVTKTGVGGLVEEKFGRSHFGTTGDEFFKFRAVAVKHVDISR